VADAKTGHTTSVRRFPTLISIFDHQIDPLNIQSSERTSQVSKTQFGISKFWYAPSATQNKIQGPNPSQLCLVPSISANVSTQNPPSHAHMKKVITLAKHLEHQRSTFGFLVTTAKELASPSFPSRYPEI
jgi:hypothetical protein